MTFIQPPGIQVIDVIPTLPPHVQNTTPLTGLEVRVFDVLNPNGPSIAYIPNPITVAFEDELSGVGSGQVTLSSDDVPSTVFAKDNIWRIYWLGIPVFSFIGETVQDVQIPSSAGHDRAVGGRGIGQWLDKMKVYPPGWPTTRRASQYTFAHSTLANIVYTMIQASQARGTASWITFGNWNGTHDSSHALWADANNITVNVGDSVLTLIQNYMTAVPFDWHMSHNGVLSLWLNAGRDRTVQVKFQPVGSMLTAEIDTDWTNLWDAILLEDNSITFSETTDPSVIATYGRRENFAAADNISDSGGVTQYISSLLNTWTSPVVEKLVQVDVTSVGRRPFIDFNLGDKVGVEFPDGTVDTARVVAISMSSISGVGLGVSTADTGSTTTGSTSTGSAGGTPVSQAALSVQAQAALDFTLERAAIPLAGTSSSGLGGGNVYSTIVVAAHNSLSGAADFVCSGTADQQTIQLAINALPVNELGEPVGKILLLEGDYHTTASISITSGQVTIEGMSSGVQEDAASTIHGSNTSTSVDDYELIHVQKPLAPDVGVEICRLSFISHASITRHGSDLGAIGEDGSNVLISIHDCSFATGSDCLGVRLNTLTGVGIGVYSPMIYNNGFNGGGGIRLGHSDGAMVFNNQFDGTDTGIDIQGGSFDCTVAFNYFDGCCSGGWAPDTSGCARPCIFFDSGLGDITCVGNFGDGSGCPFILLDSPDSATIVGNTSYADGAPINGVLDTDPLAFPLPAQPTTRVGAHGIAIRCSIGFSRPSTVGPVTVSGNMFAFDSGGAISIVNNNATNGSIIAGIVVVGNACYGIDAQPAITLDGGTYGIYDCQIQDNQAPVGTADAIVLRNKVSYCTITNNQIRGQRFHTGTESPTYPFPGPPYPINIATADCVGNLISGNDCDTGQIHDAGTNTVRAWNRYDTTKLDGPYTAIGDLMVGTGKSTWELLPVGTSGEILAVGGSDPSGLEWIPGPEEYVAVGITTSSTPLALDVMAFPNYTRTAEVEIIIVARRTSP